MPHDMVGPVFLGLLATLGPVVLFHCIKQVRENVPILVLVIFWAVTLSPSVLGKFNPELQTQLIRPELVDMYAKFGFFMIIMYLISTGGHIHLEKGIDRSTWMVIVTSTVFPMLGNMMAIYLLMQQVGTEFFLGPNGTVLTVAMAGGLSLTVSALAVMSSIYRERGLMGTPRAVRAMIVATGHEIGVWTIVALIFSLMHINGHAEQHPLVTFGLAIAFVAALAVTKKVAIVPLANTRQWNQLPGNKQLVFVLLGGVLASYVTHSIGVHFAFGAIVWGAMLPPTVIHELEKFIEPWAPLFINVYFMGALLTMNVNIGSSTVITVALVMLFLAYLGQFLGAVLPYRVSGMGWHDATIQGLDLTTKGVVELVVNNSFLSVGLISQPFFAATMLMAGACTALNVPVSKLVEWHRDRIVVTEPTFVPGMAGAMATPEVDRVEERSS